VSTSRKLGAPIQAAALSLLFWPAQSAAPAQVTAPEKVATAPTPPRLLTSDSGLVLNFIKPDKTADFEAVVAKLREALQKSPKPERRQQASSWKVFKAGELAASGNVLYVFVMDPAVKGADYTVSTILAEAFPSEAIALYKQYADSFGPGYNFVNLGLIQDLGK
jgi:hypothetical protein